MGLLIHWLRWHPIPPSTTLSAPITVVSSTFECAIVEKLFSRSQDEWEPWRQNGLWMMVWGGGRGVHPPLLVVGGPGLTIPFSPERRFSGQNFRQFRLRRRNLPLAKCYCGEERSPSFRTTGCGLPRAFLHSARRERDVLSKTHRPTGTAPGHLQIKSIFQKVGHPTARKNTVFFSPLEIRSFSTTKNAR